MLRAGVGYSAANSPATAAAEATAAALKQAGLRSADAALCFATTAHGGAYPLIMRTVAERAGTPDIAGCSAAGVIAGENEIESGAALVVMAIGGVGARRFFIPSLRGRGPEVAAELAAIARGVTGPALMCLFADTYNLEPGDFFATLNAALPPTVTLAGGGASEDGSIGETFQFCGDTVSSNSVSGILLSGAIALDIGASLACVPLGHGHRVTAVRDNVLVELDGRPAFEVFAEVAGPLAANLRRAMARVFVAIPHEPGATALTRGNHFVRNIVGASPEQGMLAIGHSPRVGDLIGFALRDAEGARNDLKSTLGELQARTVVPPVFGLYFNCVSRGRGLYDISGHDVAYIRQSIGPVPIAGFFTGFEIGPAGRAPGFLQYSGVLVLAADRVAADAAKH